MKDASTDDITEFILYDAIYGSQSHPVAHLKYIDDDGVTQRLNSVTNLSVSKSAVDNRYNQFSLLPPSSTMSAGFDNFKSIFSPSSGGDFDGVLIRNREYLPEIGYQLAPNTTTNTVTSVLETENDDLWHTQISGGKVYNDVTSEASAPINTGFGWLLNTYNGANFDNNDYGDQVYQYEGYWLSNQLSGFTHGTNTRWESITVDSDTTNIDVWYRTSGTASGLSNAIFLKLGATVSGTVTHELIPKSTDTFLQFAFTWRTGEWNNAANYIDNIKVNHIQLNQELFAQGSFLGDDPSFNVSHNNYTAGTSARDFLKRALETKINLPAYVGPTEMATVIEAILDRCNISHSIPTTGTTITLSADDTFKNVKAKDALNECLEYLNAVDDNYRMYINDSNVLVMAVKPTATINADYQLDYRFNLFNLKKTYISNQVMQRATILQTEHPTDEEVQLDTANYTTVGQKTLSWSGEAIYKRVDIDLNASDSSVTCVIDEDGTEPEQLTVTIAGSGTIDVDVTVYGNKLQTSQPFNGEAFSDANHQAKNGITHKLINRFIASDTEAKDIAEKLIDLYGNQEFKVSCTIPYNPLVEIDDKLTVFEKFSVTNTIYAVESISHSFSASGISARTTLTMNDLGIDLLNFNYDRHNIINSGIASGLDDFQHDVGRLYDQDLGPQQEQDLNDYKNTKEVQFS